MRTLAVLGGLVLVGALVVSAQDKTQATTVKVYGQGAATAVSKLETALGAHADYVDLDPRDMTDPCVVTVEDAAPADAAALASFATGYSIQLDEDGKTLRVGQAGDVARGGTVKGYDVSVLAGMYVGYVNAYAGPEKPAQRGEQAEPQRTAAQHLGELLEDTLEDPCGEAIQASVVGDRILFTLHPRDHARVRELLDLLMKDGGGESAELQADRKVVAKLKSTTLNFDYDTTPTSSVLSGICLEAGVGLALGRDLATLSVDRHIDFHMKKATAWDALQRILKGLREDDTPTTLGVRAGAVCIDVGDVSVSMGYHVYDIEELLKKLSNAYQRQRTEPGKDGGFQGDLRQQGGNQVVVDSLSDQLEAGGHPAQVLCFGTRLVVLGGGTAVDAATHILKQMGWEKPKN